MSAGGLIVVSAFESPDVVAGLDNVAVMGQSVEQRGSSSADGDRRILCRTIA